MCIRDRYTNQWIELWLAGDMSALDEFNQQYISYGMNVNYDKMCIRDSVCTDNDMNAGNSETEEIDIKAMDFSGYKILLAEDNDINAEIACEILEMSGFEVDVACNGMEALERYRNSSLGYYDLILMDIQMPEMNGYDTTVAIRSLNRKDAKEVPILAMTANAFTEDVMAAKKSGMNEHIAKPLDISQMYNILTRFLKK